MTSLRDINYNIYDKTVPEGTVISEYQIKYHVFGRSDRLNWYKFPNGEMPDPAELAGSTMEIRYDEEEPLFYDVISEVFPKDERVQPIQPRSNFRFRIEF